MRKKKNIFTYFEAFCSLRVCEGGVWPEADAVFLCVSAWLDMDSRDVLLRLIELLGEVLGRRLAGYLDEGHLLAVARQVARSLTHAVVVVPLHQEV